MELRIEIKPNVEIAEKRYPEILKSILDYTDFCDEHGDEELIEYHILETKLQKITQKDISKFNLYEWWEEEGAEVLAFRISLPDPLPLTNTTQEELAEVVKRIKTPIEFVRNNEVEINFENQFKYYFDDYYHQFLKLNFKSYKHNLFHSFKDQKGNYTEHTVDEIIHLIWNNGKV
ncbi:hypothetical protein [Flavobacterium sp. '19STA2R22 D10 B1']|uniref:hypothetical protein n=1 Tax=Flavobacterium aerium TaxID=3037261 RepID=UPI00278C6DE4|nr:hypothetical protein [Flavobacterium sp. '19STA2R22 D10 B1']